MKRHRERFIRIEETHPHRFHSKVIEAALAICPAQFGTLLQIAPNIPHGRELRFLQAHGFGGFDDQDLPKQDRIRQKDVSHLGLGRVLPPLDSSPHPD